MGKESKSILATGAIFAVLAIALGVWVYMVNGEVTALETEIGALDGEINTLAAKANGKKIKEKEETLKQLDKAVIEYVQILPNPLIMTEDKYLELFANFKKRANITLTDTVQSIAKAKGGGRRKKAKKKDFEEVNVKFEIEGRFENFVKFMSLLEKYESFLQVGSFNLNTIEGNDGRCRASMELRTFRYNISSKGKKGA
ncbi:MAG: hypothetical protein P1V97_26580 [Planctomycetota bacterium]|nr:hypothetical protein [Planctomycetota bacterium]